MFAPHPDWLTDALLLLLCTQVLRLRLNFENWDPVYEVVEKKSIEPSKLLEGGSSPLNPHQPAPHLNSGMYGTIYNIHTYIVVLED